ncbi:hypothetical protein ACISIM_08960, partial [Campylobacter coli]|uniref:hypothetical protein n=1 Tax=Campylobacter coli TaxID=195 RepID=UPI0037F1CF76
MNLLNFILSISGVGDFIIILFASMIIYAIVLVSYTHLTLPTNREVLINAEGAQIQKQYRKKHQSPDYATDRKRHSS